MPIVHVKYKENSISKDQIKQLALATAIVFAAKMTIQKRKILIRPDDVQVFMSEISENDHTSFDVVINASVHGYPERTEDVDEKVESIKMGILEYLELVNGEVSILVQIGFGQIGIASTLKREMM